jgi:hypothetical protein
MRIKRSLLFIFPLAILIFGSCRKEKLFLGSTKLNFSQDTVWFDTIFTRQPGNIYPISVTKMLSIKNKENRMVKASFRLGGGKNSPYRINIDGLAGPEIPEVEIGAKDSVFVFVQCSLDANNLTQPAIVLDSLISLVNGTEQKLLLAAYGWDAHYVRDSILPCGGQWTDKVKPYVVIDNVLVDTLCSFTIREGVTVYNSARSNFFVAGTLNIIGTASERVTFTGDKPVFVARFEPNQWVGIRLLKGNRNSIIKYADIHNAAIGIRVDSLPVGAPINLTLENTSIMYCGQACLAGVTAVINATNCVFAETGTYSFLGLYGGVYDFRHCTFSSYVNYGSRQDGHFAITNNIRDGNGFILGTRDLICTVYNCIIDGGNTEELTLDKGGSALFSPDFQNNLIKSKSKPFAGNTYNIVPKFLDIPRSDYGLDTTSPARNIASTLSPPIAIDFYGKPRIGVPDLGAIEAKK